MMLEEFGHHKSDIVQSVVAFLTEVKVARKTKHLYAELLYLFIHSLLDSHMTDSEETENGEFILNTNWEDLHSHVIDDFLDYWLPRKYLGSNETAIRAPGILRKWVNWCYEKKYFSDICYRDFNQSLPRSKAQDIKRLLKASDLIYQLHDQSTQVGKRPETILEGYMKITKISATDCTVKTEEGKTVRPVMLTEEIVQHLKVGDYANLIIGKYDSRWHVLGSGNVYAELNMPI